MNLLISGLLLWSGVHFIPSLVIPPKTKQKNALGDKDYQISFSLIVVLSLVTIVFGWRSITPSILYTPSEALRPVSMLLMVLAFLLFGASHHVTRIKQIIRHPQLTSMMVWSFAHLISNGDNRPVVLFGGMGLWALLEIFVINRREGAWVKAEVPGWPVEIKGNVISLVIFIIAAVAHPYIAGVSLHKARAASKRIEFNRTLSRSISFNNIRGVGLSKVELSNGWESRSH